MPALFLALVLGALMVLPFFYFEAKLGKDFKGIFPEIVNDSDFYYARIRDVADGHPTLGNAYLWEHKNELPQQFLAEFILAQPIKLFGVGITAARLIYNFLLPAIAFLLTYAAFFSILRKKAWSLMFSSSLFFGLYLTSFIRPVSPQFNFIFWLTQFIFLWLLVNSHHNTNTRMYANDTNNADDTNKSIPVIRVIRMSKFRSLVLLCANALNFGFLFYIYPYYWTFYLIFFGILFAAYFFNNRALSYKILSIAGGGLILAIPYFYFNYLASQLPYYTETLTRLGMIYSRFPSGLRIMLWSFIGLAAFGWFLWRRIIKLNEQTVFFISGIVSSIIAVNQHLLTGKNLEFSSHYDTGAIFFVAFALAYLISQYDASTANKLFYLKLILTIIISVVAVNGLRGYSKQIFASNKEGVYIQNYAPIFEWLNKNTPKDSVVYTNPSLSRLIPVYTANNVFYVTGANLFYISDSEVLDRFILNNFFSAFGGSASRSGSETPQGRTTGGENFSKDFVIENVRSVYGVRYIDAYGHAVQGNKLRRLLGLKPEPEIYLPDEAVQKVVFRAEELQKDNFLTGLEKYRVDYFIWDKNKNPDWRIGESFLPVFKSADITIYRVL